MPTGLFNKLIHTARKIAFHLKEKEKMTIDDHVLEHMLFYHDLSGSNQENNKETRIVRADIKEALSRENIAELCLALKLPPAFWEEQLKNIVVELDNSQQQLLGSMLLANNKNSADFDKQSYALNHEDWRVRANAASILAFLQVKESVPALIETLSSGTTDSIMSFCYTAYALGKLQGEQAKNALEKQLINSDAWLRVDAAGALSYFPFSDVAPLLAVSLLQEQEALDYMSYAISGRIKPAIFLQTGAKKEIEGGCRLIFGIIEAAENGFASKLVLDTQSHLCMPYLVELAEKDAQPIVLDTALNLCRWLCEYRDQLDSENSSISASYFLELKEQEIVIRRIADTVAVRNKILEVLENVASDLSARNGASDENGVSNRTSVDDRNPAGNRNAEFVHALRLAAELDISNAQPPLARILKELSLNSSFNSGLNCRLNLNANEPKNVIIAISLLSANKQESADLLINLANKIVDFEQRINLNKNKQPVSEENISGLKLYWEILKALGNLGTDNAVSFLEQALNDYAPDMRSRALESIIEICRKDSAINLPKPVEQILQIALKDPSAMMQLIALSGVAKLDQANLINDVLPLINAQENTVSKEAISSLACLSKGGHEVDVKTMLKEKIKTVREEHKRQRILEILQN